MYIEEEVVHDPNEKYLLCIECRGLFSEKDVEQPTNACPGCGSIGIPGDVSFKHTIDLTDHEWRLLFMWAHNHARSMEQSRESVIDSIIKEVRNQHPDMPPLSMREEFEGLQREFGIEGVEMTDSQGKKLYEDSKPEDKYKH